MIIDDFLVAMRTLDHEVNLMIYVYEAAQDPYVKFTIRMSREFYHLFVRNFAFQTNFNPVDPKYRNIEVVVEDLEDTPFIIGRKYVGDWVNGKDRFVVYQT